MVYAFSILTFCIIRILYIKFKRMLKSKKP
nr:MAG TPA: ATP synthase subunit alpha [Caudoviricetes sp.]